MYKLRKKRKIVVKGIDNMVYYPATSSSKALMTKDIRKSFEEYEVNIRAVLAAFFIGTGGYDVTEGFSDGWCPLSLNR